ncbi:MAG: MerR family transcriptional regulator [Deltaproteobacteria bacterium]|nr:MerR family transcriptional regulator [Deltaproteobacteria bacterium]MBW2068583.1 MerR family transcriptional regulator [Deltaproteobacteria bacterium]
MAERSKPVSIRYVNYTKYLRCEQVASICGVHPELIERFVKLGLIDPTDRDPVNESWLFPPEVVPIVKRIIRLRRDLGINYAGIGVVLELLNRLEELERRISVLEMHLKRFMKE